MNKINLTISCIIGILLLNGCATTNLRVSPDFKPDPVRVKIIAVLPADIKIYKLTAGGIRELIDEWNEKSKALVQQALQKYLVQNYGYNIKFIQEDLLEKNCKSTWDSTKPLYNLVATNILMHAYPGFNAFVSKLNNFDYTLGPDVKKIADLCGADTLLFVSGFDHEATAGRNMLACWNVFAGAITGVTTILLSPSFMSVALVDGQTGNLLYFNTSPASAEYSFRDKGSIDTLIEWLTRGFSVKK